MTRATTRYAIATLMCLSAGATHAHGRVDITNAVLTKTDHDCAAYASDYTARATDKQQRRTFASNVRVTANNRTCTIQSNSVPNHDFGAGSRRDFVSPVREISLKVSIPRNPKLSQRKTALSQQSYDAIMLNGVVLDILSAGCYRPNGRRADRNGNVAIGCRSNDKWLVDPLAPSSGFGTDTHNAHTQPNGQYHYHGNPMALFDNNPGANGSPVIGFAADGFPIFGSYFRDESGKVRKARSGYQLKQGNRPRSPRDPGGRYDGMYVDDYVFTGAGDLDECNGMTVNGQYGYYVTDSYPWVMKCFSGKPERSFKKSGR